MTGVDWGWRLLGPVAAVSPHGEAEPGPGKQRCVLTALLLTPGETVPVDTLVDRVWGESPPRSRSALAPYVTRLRQVIARLAPDGSLGTLRFAAGGYRLDCDPGRVDLHRARALVKVAGTVGDDAAARLLHEALAGWPAVALAGVPGEWAGRMRASLARERLELIGRLAGTEVRLGRPAAVIERLRPIADEDPSAESVVVPLVEALAAAGRETEALDWYARAGAAIAENLGAEPSERLRRLHVRILRSGQPPRPAAPPCHLPAAMPWFTGRAAELSALDGGHAPVVTISGMAGVGKTALAVHWAHGAADRFPDGRLYVNLHGFDSAGAAVDPADAIRGVLGALGVEPHDVPADRAGQAALFRRLTSERRLLLILDNARDAGQVRPLLIGGPGVRTLITGRDRLTALVAEFGAQPIVLGVPGAAEAAEILHRRSGTTEPDEDGTADVVAACGRLPLALALVAARARVTGFRLATVAAELREPEILAGVRAVFSWSYRVLGPDSARMFRLLGLAAGPDLVAEAAAALAGASIADTRRILRELADASLLTEPAPGRFTMHDLLRAYAADLAGRIDPPDERRAGLTRLLDHYAQVAYHADRVLNPTRAPIPGGPLPGGSPARFDRAAALDWLTAEHAALLSALRQAADEGLDRYAWQLGWALDTFLYEQHHWQDQGAAWTVVLRSATAMLDRPAAAHAHRFLGVVAGRLARFAEAHEHMRRSAELCRAAGDRAGAAEHTFILSYVCWLQGDHDQAIAHVETSLADWAGLGHHAWEGKASNAAGWYHAQLGRHRQALAYAERAVAAERRAGDKANEAVALSGLGQAHQALGRPEAALPAYDQALVLARAVPDPMLEAQVLTQLGDTCTALGADDLAREHYENALKILTDAAHPAAADVARKLA